MSVAATLDPTATMVGGVHHLFWAPFGATLPTDVGTSPGNGLDTAFKHVGYTDAAGSAFKVDSQTQDLYASQSNDPIRTIIQTKKATITSPLIEISNPFALQAAFGGGTFTDTTNGTKFVPAAAGTIDETSWVLDVVDGDEITRIVIERALVSGSVDVALVKTALSSFPLTINALAPVTLPSSWFLVGTNDALAGGIPS